MTELYDRGHDRIGFYMVEIYTKINYIWSIHVKNVYLEACTMGHCWDLTTQIHNLPFWEQMLLCMLFYGL